MKTLIILIPFLLAFWLSSVIIPVIYVVSFRKRLFDPINHRKVHGNIIPRLGGVSFAPIQCCLMTLAVVIFHKYNFLNDLHLNTGEILPMFLMLTTGLVMLFVVGLADDLIGVNYKFKFFAQLIAASLLPLSGLWINDMYGVFFITSLPMWFGMPFTIFVTMLIINSINLIDGIDGLCSGIIMFSSFILGVLFVIEQAWLHAIFAFITTGILLPFFYFNVFGASKKKRRIFMGDTGSLTLGYAVAFLAISFSMNNADIKPFSEGAIVSAFSTLMIPVLDVARVMWVRKLNGRPIFQPDRGHIHHKFLDLGLSHRRTMIAIILIAVFFSLFNIISVQYISNNIVLALDLVLWILFQVSFDIIEKRVKKNKLIAVEETTN
ncbi:undecaprenyl/decaprenyl-phosphate alpha-N-acetylglucosaminyl 1-phosphate transferase [Sphingobacteriaceae bacterium WQ 2009]|uniref:Undecaprenyl/decaprenyl-phosphate alpha-N-acetylglucosaminyl 1-phosphate transferase n=2 Tax=Rhinopithecimicrobium faecis TaxID=2820698 RepID=A0A8T4H9J6_9SPHI|nr:undecaprenyl/decaprenyl-phosphate alpha-N-acetylglucosaminyl 1-phosphate transferase [Sphingobacteriaceae bacterium WQ 2009]